MRTMTFKLGPILEKDSIFITNLNLSQMRIMNNAHFPWIILVPRIDGVSEITDLSNDDYRLLNAEIRLVAKIMQIIFEPDKLNIATLGNKVRQLHYHIIARYENDGCFPDPVWGYPSTPYDDSVLNLRIDNIKQLLGIK